MQRCNCSVRLSGDLGNTVFKTGVSPAEIVILRAIHGGDDSVIDIQPTGMDRTPSGQHANERNRLAFIYGAETVERIFPGKFSKLPVTLKDVEPTMEESDEQEESQEEGDQEDKVNGNGVVERMEAMDPKPFDEDDLTPDDKALIAMIQGTETIGALRAIATANEVEVTSVPANVPDAKLHLIRSLFPMYKQE